MNDPNVPADAAIGQSVTCGGRGIVEVAQVDRHGRRFAGRHSACGRRSGYRSCRGRDRCGRRCGRDRPSRPRRLDRHIRPQSSQSASQVPPCRRRVVTGDHRSARSVRALSRPPRRLTHSLFWPAFYLAGILYRGAVRER
jgi:hypothetical protein